MKELWKKYTRTQDQRIAIAFGVFLLLIALGTAIFLTPLFVFLIFIALLISILWLVVWIVSKWIDKGDII